MTRAAGHGAAEEDRVLEAIRVVTSQHDRENRVMAVMTDYRGRRGVQAGGRGL